MEKHKFKISILLISILAEEVYSQVPGCFTSPETFSRIQYICPLTCTSPFYYEHEVFLPPNY